MVQGLVSRSDGFKARSENPVLPASAQRQKLPVHLRYKNICTPSGIWQNFSHFSSWLLSLGVLDLYVLALHPQQLAVEAR